MTVDLSGQKPCCCLIEVLICELHDIHDQALKNLSQSQLYHRRSVAPNILSIPTLMDGYQEAKFKISGKLTTLEQRGEKNQKMGSQTLRTNPLGAGIISSWPVSLATKLHEILLHIGCRYLPS